MKYIYLYSGEAVMVDDADYARVATVRWHLHPQGYACGWLGYGRKGRYKVLMHRFILQAPDGAVVDHVNRNKLDNRRANLEVTTQTNNLRKRAAKKGVQYKGVCTYRNGWRMSIARKLYYGFTDPIEAARAYDREAIRLYGEYAATNFPRSDYE